MMVGGGGLFFLITSSPHVKIRFIIEYSPERCYYMFGAGKDLLTTVTLYVSLQ